MDYTVLEDSEALVTEKTGLSPTDLETLLAVSAGLKGSTTFYRPYYVSAVLLDSALHTRKLVKGEGAEFDQPDKTVRGLLDLQHAIDLAEGLVLPPGMEATYKQPRRVPGRLSSVAPTGGRW